MDAYDLLRIKVWSFVVASTAMFILAAQDAHAQNQEVPGCGRLGLNYVGYAMDYYKSKPSERQLVEGAHFKDEHAALSIGKTTINNKSAQGPVAGGLDYVLRVWPNHPGALADLVKYTRIKKSERPDGMMVASCYFKRAIVFVPEDGMVRLLYAIYLLEFGYAQEALEQAELAEKLIETPTTNHLYNLGLIYFELKRYDDARRLAAEVYGRGYELPGLRKKLERAGEWQPSGVVQ